MVYRYARLFASLACVLGLALTAVLLFLRVPSVTAEENTPAFKLLESQKYVYRLDDLRRQGLSVGLASNVDKNLTVILSLVDPFTEERRHLSSDTPTLVTSTVELPAKKTIMHTIPVKVEVEVVPGKYTALLVADDGEGTVVEKEVTIFVAHALWPWPTLFIVLGVLFSWVLTKYRDRKPKQALHARRESLYKAIGKDHEDFKKEHKGKPYVGFSIVESAGKQLDDLTSLIEHGKLEDVETSLKSTKEWFQSFRVFRRDQVVRLYRQFEELKKLLEDRGEQDHPQCLEKVLDLLEGGVIEDAPHLQTWKDRVKDWPGLLDQWKGIYAQMVDAEWYVRALSKTTWTQPDHKTQYNNSHNALVRAHTCLWTAITAQALTAYDLAKSVRDAWSTLCGLWEDYGTPHPPKFKALRKPLQLLTGQLDNAWDRARKRGIKEALGKMGWQLWGLSAILLSLFSAVLAGLLAVYFATGTVNTFGRNEDYLTAILWGFGVDRTVNGLGGVLEKVGGFIGKAEG